MKRGHLLWLAAAAALAVIVAAQVLTGAGGGGPTASAGAPTVTPGTDVLAGVSVVPRRVRGNDYRRVAFGDSWDDDNGAPGGHNGCDTRDDILTRDLVNITYTHTKRCQSRHQRHQQISGDKQHDAQHEQGLATIAISGHASRISHR